MKSILSLALAAVVAFFGVSCKSTKKGSAENGDPNAYSGNEYSDNVYTQGGGYNDNNYDYTYNDNQGGNQGGNRELRSIRRGLWEPAQSSRRQRKLRHSGEFRRRERLRELPASVHPQLRQFSRLGANVYRPEGRQPLSYQPAARDDGRQVDGGQRIEFDADSPGRCALDPLKAYREAGICGNFSETEGRWSGGTGDTASGLRAAFYSPIGEPPAMPGRLSKFNLSRSRRLATSWLPPCEVVLGAQRARSY